MKVKARARNNVVSVRVLIEHPMETGFRKDAKTGDVIPAKFVRHFECQHHGRVVFTAHFGRAVSRNPYLSFAFVGGQAGDALVLGWRDNTGAHETVEVVIA